jgi:Amt family ammonium transporter
MWGLLAVPITNDEASLKIQLLGLASIFVWVFVTSFAIWFLIKKTLGIRVDEQQEYEGVDLSECGLEAYPEFTSAE